MTIVSLLISAIVAIIGIWTDAFKGPKRQRNQHKKREMIVRLIGTILALSALGAGYKDYRDDQSENQVKEAKTKEELRSAHNAYDTLRRTYLEAIRTGKAVKNIDIVSQNLRDSLDTASHRISYFSMAQLRNLARLHQGTEALLNPVPDHLIVSWFIRYQVPPEEVKALDEGLKGRQYNGNDGHTLNDTLLYQIYKPWTFLEISGLRFELKTKDKSIAYSGELENYNLPDANSQDLNDAAKPYVNIFYSHSEHVIQFDGTQRLRLGEIKGEVTGLLDFGVCDLLFNPGFISSKIKNIKIESISVFAGLRNTNKFGSHDHWHYDTKQEGFVLKEQKILVQRKNLYQ